ncbi:MAG: hypothetical protein KAH23_05355 [Kiritimatiellae bacterium]|nr:hypothetical protein [Kiritimatiellia bacterium]
MKMKWVIRLIAVFVLMNGAAFADQDDVEDRELTEDTMLFLKRRLPEAVEILNHMKKDEDGEKYDDRRDEWIEWYDEYKDLTEEEPKEAAAMLEHAKLNLRAETMAIRIRNIPDDAAQQAASKDLQEILEKTLDAQLERLEEEIVMRMKEVEELQILVAKRKKYREKIIRRRLERMLEEDEEALDWW